MTNPHILNIDDISVDISFLYEVAGNDVDCINAMVETFLKTFPVTISKMEQSLEQKDYEGLYKAAHHSKSSLSVVKISGAFETAEKLEKLARTKSEVDQYPILLSSLKNKYLLSEKVLLEKFGSIV